MGDMNYLHAKQSLREILTGSVFNCLMEVETFTSKNIRNSHQLMDQNHEVKLNETTKKQKTEGEINLRLIRGLGRGGFERDYASLRWRYVVVEVSNPKRGGELIRHEWQIGLAREFLKIRD